MKNSTKYWNMIRRLHQAGAGFGVRLVNVHGDHENATDAGHVYGTEGYWAACIDSAAMGAEFRAADAGIEVGHIISGRPVRAESMANDTNRYTLALHGFKREKCRLTYAESYVRFFPRDDYGDYMLVVYLDDHSANAFSDCSAVSAHGYDASCRCGEDFQRFLIDAISAHTV